MIDITPFRLDKHEPTQDERIAAADNVRAAVVLLNDAIAEASRVELRVRMEQYPFGNAYFVEITQTL